MGRVRQPCGVSGKGMHCGWYNYNNKSNEVMMMPLQVQSSQGAADEECKLMTMAEISYIDRIRQLQIKNLQQNTPRKYTKH